MTRLPRLRACSTARCGARGGGRRRAAAGRAPGETRRAQTRASRPAALTHPPPNHKKTRQVDAGLASWAVDFCAVVCADAGVLSDDPGSTRLLSEEAAAGWCRSAAGAAAGALRAALGGGGGGGELERIGAAAEALSHVARALRGAPGGGRCGGGRGGVRGGAHTGRRLSRAAPSDVYPCSLRRAALRRARSSPSWRTPPPRRNDLSGLPQRLALIQEAAAALACCAAAGAPPAAPPPGHPSRAAWARAVGARRSAAPGGRLFLDDLIEAASGAGGGGGGGGASAPASPTSGARTPRGGRGRASAAGGLGSYPWGSPGAAVEALYGAALDGSTPAPACSAAVAADAARAARLALLFYFLVDGGWAGGGGGGGEGEGGAVVSPAAFSRALALPPGAAAQWEATQLLDRAAAGGPGGDACLVHAAALLLGCAHAGTPFRAVEALAAAGRPADALAVQRARGDPPGALREARVLLAARLACGLLQEAHAGAAAHCAQVRRARGVEGVEGGAFAALGGLPLGRERFCAPPRPDGPSPAHAAPLPPTPPSPYKVASAEERAAHLEALMGDLLEWAARRDAAGAAEPVGAAAAGTGGWLQQVAALPLGPEEEAVAAAWLAARGSGGGGADGELLPRYLLQVGAGGVGWGGAAPKGLCFRGQGVPGQGPRRAHSYPARRSRTPPPRSAAARSRRSPRTPAGATAPRPPRPRRRRAAPPPPRARRSCGR
jgi:hypothetical protein